MPAPQDHEEGSVHSVEMKKCDQFRLQVDCIVGVSAHPMDEAIPLPCMPLLPIAASTVCRTCLCPSFPCDIFGEFGSSAYRCISKGDHRLRFPMSSCL